MRKRVVIVGGGTCALMLGCGLDPEKFDVAIYEKNAAAGRKFLVAGDGGLNLTHSEKAAEFIQRYTPFAFLETAFSHFSNEDLVRWLNGSGVETRVGSSGRVFPADNVKPIEVLNVFLEKIAANGFTLHTRQKWQGFSKNRHLIFAGKDGETEVGYDIVIFCLGGASWPVTGSSGDWTGFFKEKDIAVYPFQSSNCAFRVDWPEAFLSKAEGKSLKNIRIRCHAKTHAGEVIITRFGIEGSGIYPLSPEIRSALATEGSATIFIDLKPSLTEERLVEKLRSDKTGKNFTAKLKTQLNLSAAALLLIKQFLPKDAFLDLHRLCHFIKEFPLTVTAPGPVDDAISTVGGISLQEIDAHFQLKRLPGHFAIGEMLDYDAPTGGYLLQSCFSMGKFLADHLNSTSDH